MEAFLQNLIAKKMRAESEAAGGGGGGNEPPSPPPQEPVISSFDLAGVAELIREGKAKNVIVMAGAGAELPPSQLTSNTRANLHSSDPGIQRCKSPLPHRRPENHLGNRTDASITSCQRTPPSPALLFSSVAFEHHHNPLHNLLELEKVCPI